MSAVHAVNEEMFRQMGVEEDFFDSICIAPDDPSRLRDPSYRKPNPRFELEMMETYQLEKRACYMVGDRLSDMATGKNAGINCVGIVGDNDRLDFQNAGALVFASVAAFIDSVID